MFSPHLKQLTGVYPLKTSWISWVLSVTLQLWKLNPTMPSVFLVSTWTKSRKIIVPQDTRNDVLYRKKDIIVPFSNLELPGPSLKSSTVLQNLKSWCRLHLSWEIVRISVKKKKKSLLTRKALNNLPTILDFDDDGTLDSNDLEKLVNCLTGDTDETRLTPEEMRQLISNVSVYSV